jgi:hypothetical protein
VFASLVTVAGLVLVIAVPGNAGREFGGSDLISANGIGTPLDISSGPMTVAFWFYATAVDGAEHDLVSHWQGGTGGAQWMICIGCDSVINNGGLPHPKGVEWEVGCCGNLTGVYGACPDTQPNTWYHVILWVDANGKYSGSPAAGLNQTGICGGSGQGFREKRLPGGANLNIGGHDGIGDFIGTIAEVGIWNDILSPSERAALDAGVSPNRIRRSALVGYFPLYGAASSEPDYSGKNDDGTLIGTTAANHCPCEPPTE